MLRYLIRRILWAIVLFVVVTLVTYVIFFLVPNDLAAKVAGQGSSQEQRARAIHHLGLDRMETWGTPTSARARSTAWSSRRRR
jgi:peptide/nickel transport system permease protein